MAGYGDREERSVPSMVVCGSKVCVSGSKHSIAALSLESARLFGTGGLALSYLVRIGRPRA